MQGIQNRAPGDGNCRKRRIRSASAKWKKEIPAFFLACQTHGVSVSSHWGKDESNDDACAQFSGLAFTEQGAIMSQRYAPSCA
jgi:hypothetical protein